MSREWGNDSSWVNAARRPKPKKTKAKRKSDPRLKVVRGKKGSGSSAKSIVVLAVGIYGTALAAIIGSLAYALVGHMN